MREKIFKKFQIICILLVFTGIFFYVLKEHKMIIWNYEYLKRSNREIAFVFPFVNKSISNDTFFTIAIGKNILEKGFSNYDRLTFHEDLKFPHSGVFDLILNAIYQIGSFKRNLYLHYFYGTMYIY